MNYIQNLKSENQSLKNKLEEINNELIQLKAYYMSSKFQGFENDYAYVSTDVMHRLDNLSKTVNSQFEKSELINLELNKF